MCAILISTTLEFWIYMSAGKHYVKNSMHCLYAGKWSVHGFSGVITAFKIKQITRQWFFKCLLLKSSLIFTNSMLLCT